MGTAGHLSATGDESLFNAILPEAPTDDLPNRPVLAYPDPLALLLGGTPGGAAMTMLRGHRAINFDRVNAYLDARDDLSRLMSSGAARSDLEAARRRAEARWEALPKSKRTPIKPPPML